MTIKEKEQLMELGQQLSTLGVEFRIAQIGLENIVKQHGLCSLEAVNASTLCSNLAQRFSQAEEEFHALKQKLTSPS